MNTAPRAASEVAKWIVEYLERNPRAADTPPGIQRWWLAPCFGEVPLEVVEEALAELERQGVVQQLDPSVPGPAYGRGPRFDQHA
jgi:hypothetical protein